MKKHFDSIEIFILIVAVLMIVAFVVSLFVYGEPAAEIGTALTCEQIQGVVVCVER